MPSLAERFEPGEWLLRRDLPRESGVGDSTVREALNHLVAQGYLVSETNWGFRTTVPTLDFMLDHGRVFLLLEPRELELVAEHT